MSISTLVSCKEQHNCGLKRCFTCHRLIKSISKTCITIDVSTIYSLQPTPTPCGTNKFYWFNMPELTTLLDNTKQINKNKCESCKKYNISTTYYLFLYINCISTNYYVYLEIHYIFPHTHVSMISVVPPNRQQ